MKQSEVKEYNGKEGKRAYIIYKDKIYDVTDSKLWKNGTHMNRHKAGEDLTSFISMAPHGEELLERDNIKYIGELEKEESPVDKKQKYRDLYSKLHPHPVFIHYPMGILYFGAFMLLLYFFTKNPSFEKASFYALVVGTLAIFPAVASGLISWWLNYDLTMTKVFKNKIIFSCILLILTIPLAVARILVPDLVTAGSFATFIYTCGYFVSIPVLTFIAYNGGKITWPN